jgi:hypothetical protein
MHLLFFFFVNLIALQELAAVPGRFGLHAPGSDDLSVKTAADMIKQV